MDIATVIGLALGVIGVFGGQLLEGGSPMALINIPAFMIVFVGTLGTIFIAYPMSRVIGLPKAVMKAFFPSKVNEEEVVALFVQMADKARREGLLSLEDDSQKLEDAFLRKGMLLMIDGTDPEVVRSILEIDMEAAEKRHHGNVQMLETAGGFFPTLGIIGAVLGLIAVLSQPRRPGGSGTRHRPGVYRHVLRRVRRERLRPADRRQAQVQRRDGDARTRGDARRHPGDSGGREPAHRQGEARGLPRSGRSRQGSERHQGQRRRRRRGGSVSRRKKRVAAEGHGGSERWLITYADLLTLLFAFFIVLFAISNADLEKFKAFSGSLNSAFGGGGSGVLQGGGEVLEGGGSLLPAAAALQASDLAAITESINDFAAENGLEGRLGVRSEQQEIVISLSDNMLFDPASARLREESLAALNHVAGLLRDLSNDVRVEGHTDSIPLDTDAYASNWELSSARATEVLRYLTEQAGIDPKRLHAAAYADTRPIADNATPDGRAKNRRADIVIVYPQGTAPPTTSASPATGDTPSAEAGPASGASPASH